MKKLLFTLTLLVSVFFAHNASAQWTDLFSSNGNTGKTELSSNKSASIKWEVTEYNFGDIKQNVPKKIEYTFTNTGDKPVFITNAEASCGCTKLEYEKSPVLPGKTGKISTVFDAKELGTFNKTVTVYTSLETPNDVFELRLNGNVVK
ncbi:MAG: DUF1573 domain-containing protein [Bacteroidales bacterium]|jgi:hypothetical protein|nr:DUF1573 domain-containing protein [Bacteroidales bacterium]